MTAPEQKELLRRKALARRRDLVQQQGPRGRAEQSRALAAHALSWMRGHDLTPRPGLTVLAYEQLRTEPPTADLVSDLREAGVRVLLPITLPDRLDWTDGTGVSGASVLNEVDLAFVPALLVAVDGTRLGRGKGYYDAVLPALPPRAPTVALLHDHEWVAQVPAEPHDVPVQAVLTAATGLRWSSRSRGAAPG